MRENRYAQTSWRHHYCSPRRPPHPVTPLAVRFSVFLHTCASFARRLLHSCLYLAFSLLSANGFLSFPCSEFRCLAFQVRTFDEHEDSVYSLAWSASDAWVLASLSYDGLVVLNHVPSTEKYKILL